MEVFALMGEWNYEGSLDTYLLGVYASEQAAIDAHGVYTRDRERFIDRYYVVRQALDAYVDDIDYDRMYI